MASAIRALTWIGLAAVAVWTLAGIQQLGQTRYFTIDEYQYAHATWLVSQGHVPYVDFYEHHFPLSYVLHAPLVAEEGGFPERALRLRTVVFGWMLLLALGAGCVTARVTGNALTGPLAASVPFAIGFGLMSSVEYRADSLAAFTWLGCVLALEANRRKRSAAVAALAGLSATLAVFMTQKMLVLAGGSLLALLLFDRWRGREGRVDDTPFVARPLVFCVAALLSGLVLLGVAAALGMLGPGWERTILQAFAHEEYYPGVDVGRWFTPYLIETWPTALALLVFAIVGFSHTTGALWRIPLAVSLIFGLLIRGQYPYNYVAPVLVSGLLAVRGFALLAERVPLGRFAILRPLLYTAPLLLLPQQLAFTDGRTGNAHQLHVLRKIERFTEPGDVVIDGAGGAMFRDHASYYWYHGDAHRRMFADYFAGPLVEDYRRSRAPFWIRDFRLWKLPKSVQEYFLSHYVSADGALHALGFATPPSDEEPVEVTIDVISPGLYHVYPAPGGRVAEHGGAAGLRVDGVSVEDAPVRLSEGRHRVTVDIGAPPHVITPHSRSVFLQRFEINRPHAPLFEYRRRSEAAGRSRSQ